MLNVEDRNYGSDSIKLNPTRSTVLMPIFSPLTVKMLWVHCPVLFSIVVTKLRSKEKKCKDRL